LSSKESKIDFWNLYTSNVVSNTLSLLLFLSSFPWLIIYTWELKDSGSEWAPLASGTLMTISVYLLGQNSSGYLSKKFSTENNE
jgi:hypothetical protein